MVAIWLSDIPAPESYTISFDGQGGPAGFGKGSAKVLLTPNADGHLLSYTVHASVGGKVAQMGQRLIDGAAKSMAEDFFKRFDAEMQRQYPQAYAEKVPAAAVAAPAADAPKAVPVWVWGALAVAVAAAVYWLSR
jgi:hypothetical protein